MKIVPGEYRIIRHAYWSIDGSDLITITEVSDEYVSYFYNFESKEKLRSRDVADFTSGSIGLIMCSSLIKELL